MGNLVSGMLDQKMKQSQEFAVSSQERMFHRQLQMQNYMREQGMAMQIARSRDIFKWFSAFYVTAAFFGTIAFIKTKKPGPLVPLIPFSFIGAYQYDMGYGRKLERMQEDARQILSDTPELLEIPTGLPTLNLLDERRCRCKGKK